MPIYEYRCRSCGRKNTYLVLNLSRPPELVCRQCGGGDLEKLVSRVAVLRSGGDRMERMADSAGTADIDENDPRSVARWMKKMGRGMGDDLGEDFDQSIDEALEEGESAGGVPGGAGEEPEGWAPETPEDSEV